MVRTIITLPHQMKVWLDNYSQAHKQSIAETIREAIKEYKGKTEREEKKNIIHKTSGLWKDREINGLEYTKNLREEWE